MKRLKIDSKEFADYVVECAINDVHNKLLLLSEYAIHLDKFRGKVNAQWHNIGAHWCYLKYAQLYEPDTPTKNHWKAELEQFIAILKNATLKNNANKITHLRRVMIDENELNNPKANFDHFVADLLSEGFSDEEKIWNVCTNLAEYGISRIMDVICNPRVQIRKYLDDEFGD